MSRPRALQYLFGNVKYVHKQACSPNKHYYKIQKSTTDTSILFTSVNINSSFDFIVNKNK